MLINVKALKAFANSLRTAETSKCESCGKQVQEDYLINSLCGECNDTKEEDDAFHAEMDKSKLASLKAFANSLRKKAILDEDMGAEKDRRLDEKYTTNLKTVQSIASGIEQAKNNLINIYKNGPHADARHRQPPSSALPKIFTQEEYAILMEARNNIEVLAGWLDMIRKPSI